MKLISVIFSPYREKPTVRGDVLWVHHAMLAQRTAHTQHMGRAKDTRSLIICNFLYFIFIFRSKR